MKKYILLLIGGFLLAQCQKDSGFNDLAGSTTLNGIAFIADSLNGPATLMLAPNLKVYLRYATQTSGYLTSNKADGLGQYSFNGIDPDSSYTVYAYTDTGVVKYYGEITYPPHTIVDRKSDTLKLYAAQQTQNGIHLLVQDTTSTRIPSVTAWVFNSLPLFHADTSAGRAFDLATNLYGVGNKFNLAPGNYYFRVKTHIGNRDMFGEASVTLDQVGIKTVVLVLRDITQDRNGIELTLNDKWSTPASNATAYFYRSYASYLADSITIGAGNYLFPVTANAAGLAAIYNIDSAKYYFRAQKIIGTDTIRATDSIVDMGAHKISRLTRTMK